MIRIGVLGAGHLGKIHMKCIQGIDDLELVGYFDPASSAKSGVSRILEVRSFDTANELMNECDALVISSTTGSHFELAKDGILAGKHLFIEKPVTETPEEANALIDLSSGTNLKIQVGHVERYNPAFLAIKGIDLHPMFIEAHRLSTFNPRGTDVSVVHDLMIHDLDLILHLIGSEVKTVWANGVAVLSDTSDICSARIEFENGSVVNLTASRISMKNLRKMRLFQKDAYIGLDFLEKKAELIRIHDEGEINPEDLKDKVHFEISLPNKKKVLTVDMPEIKESNAIQLELQHFADVIRNDREPEVNLSHGQKALQLAHDISNQVEHNLNRILK